MPATLVDLPVELLYEIQLYALCPTLPQISKSLFQVFKTAPPSWQTEYILGRLESVPSDQTLTAALRYPNCHIQVFDAILNRIKHPENEKTLFSEDDHPLPFLHQLYARADERKFKLQVDANNGYALVKAVLSGFTPLIKFLLDHGASPTRGDGLSLMVAIRRKDLVLVKMLVERGEASLSTAAAALSSPVRSFPNVSEPECAAERGKRKRSLADEGTRPAKRARLEDRVELTSVMVKMAVRYKARDIVQYFVREKGCIPDIETLSMMK